MLFPMAAAADEFFKKNLLFTPNCMVHSIIYIDYIHFYTTCIYDSECKFTALWQPNFFSVPPGSPVITSSKDRIEIGDTITLTCTSKRGVPAPSVKWYRGENEISPIYNTVGDLTTNTYTFTASDRDQFAVYECRVFNNVLQNPLTNTIFIIVYSKYI